MLGQPRPVLLWMRGQRIVLGGEFVTWGHPVFSGQETRICDTRHSDRRLQYYSFLIVSQVKSRSPNLLVS